MQPARAFPQVGIRAERFAISALHAAESVESIDVGVGSRRKHFIRTIIEEDLASGKHERVVVRFPPEPNGPVHFMIV